MALSVRHYDELSVARVGDAFVDRVYAKLCPVYDLIFGAPLQAGRIAAIAGMDLRPGSSVLEVGVGTGLNAVLYPRDCRVTAIDRSASMLDKARERIRLRGLTNVRVMEMDAANLTFRDEAFDRVYAPYLISVVSDPVSVMREMVRVCRRGGMVVILNHFRSNHPLLSRIERAISPLTVHVGFKADLDLPALMAQAGLQPVSIQKVNRPRLWSLVTCIKN